MDKRKASRKGSRGQAALNKHDMKATFHSLSGVLGGVMSVLGLEKRLREYTLTTLWPTFVPAMIAERSRPIFIDSEGALVVAVANASCGQELSLIKTRVLSKLIPTAKALGVEIRGLRLDLKHYHRQPEIHSLSPGVASNLQRPKDSDLQAVVLGENDRLSVERLKEDLEKDCSEPMFAAKILKLFEGQLRLRHWQLLHQYPTCTACLNPAPRLHAVKQGAESLEAHLCPACFFSL